MPNSNAAEWEATFREAIRNGRPPDALNQYIENEWDRFMSRIIPGTDGHTYWPNQEKRFTRNNGTGRNAAYYWYEHNNGPLEKRAVLKPTCGEMNCIAPPHQQIIPWGDMKQRYTDAQCLGALQVAAMRLGHTPTKYEYRVANLRPNYKIIMARFGSWDGAVRVACLPPAVGRTPKWSDDDLLNALRVFTQRHRFVPSGAEWARNRLSPSQKTIERRYGGWPRALEAAGLA